MKDKFESIFFFYLLVKVESKVPISIIDGVRLYARWQLQSTIRKLDIIYIVSFFLTLF
jgi:hypothetical protein